MIIFFYIQSIFFYLKKFYLLIKSSPNHNDNSYSKYNELIYNRERFFFFGSHSKKYNSSQFNNLTLTIKYLFNNLYKPKYFIDIGSYIGLYSFVVSNLKKKIKIFAFEPSKINFNLLKKNLQKKSCSIYNMGISNKNSVGYLNNPKNYFSEVLQNLSTIPSMKSLHNNKLKWGKRTGELCNLVKIDEILDKNVIINSYIKIDTEGHEFEILRYLSSKNLIPKIISVELNNFYILKRFMHPKKYLGIFFDKKLFNYYIISKKKQILKKINIDKLETFFISYKINSFKNLIANFIRIKPIAFDLYIVKK
jgi:FkbM family methyltransferase